MYRSTAPGLRTFVSALLFSFPLGLPASATAQAAPFSHPDGTTHWYRSVAVGGGATFAEARAGAAAAGGYLATITSAKENEFVGALVDDGDLWSKGSSGEWRGPWLGGVQSEAATAPAEGWFWSELEAMSFLAWSAGQPDDDGGADRMHFGGADTGRTATWGDAAASTRLPGYVVEFSGATAPRTVGLHRRDPGSFDGYTLLYPFRGKETFLLDPRGRTVHTWNSDYPHGVVYLEPNGHLLRSGVVANPVFSAGGGSGVVEEFDWCGRRRWKFELSNDKEYLHHDLARLPNGNVLMTVWERIPGTAAVAAGRDPAVLTDGELWPDKIIEVEPRHGRIVWEWRAWDHLVQDFDGEKANYGSVRDHPELIDINVFAVTGADWMHANALNYNAKLDQVMLSVRHFSELWVIDHSTTTAQAAGHKGGRSGKGGDLLYRWGNPQAYRAGTEHDQELFFQHDAHWIADGLPGAGNILVFNNGSLRTWSSIEEIVPPKTDSKGNYPRTSTNTWGPTDPVWHYEAEERSSFFSSFISGCERMPNGNTVICSGAEGRVFEVTRQGATVWEYENPVVGETPLVHGSGVAGNFLFRAPRYAPDHPALEGRKLRPRDPVETYGTALLIDGSTAPRRAPIGARVKLELRTAVPAEARGYYQLVASATAGTIPIGFRDIRLGCDPLCIASVGGAARKVFRRYFGRFDGKGEASAEIALPRLAGLVGLRLRTAFVSLDPRTGAVGTISNTVLLIVEK